MCQSTQLTRHKPKTLLPTPTSTTWNMVSLNSSNGVSSSPVGSSALYEFRSIGSACLVWRSIIPVWCSSRKINYEGENICGNYIVIPNKSIIYRNLVCILERPIIPLASVVTENIWVRNLALSKANSMNHFT